MVQPGSQNTDTEQTDHMHLDGDWNVQKLLLKLSEQVQKLKEEKSGSCAETKIKNI